MTIQITKHIHHAPSRQCITYAYYAFVTVCTLQQNSEKYVLEVQCSLKPQGLINKCPNNDAIYRINILRLGL
jgi:hypothetical protein